MPLLVVAEAESPDKALLQALGAAGAADIAHANCHTMVQLAGQLAPQQVLLHMPTLPPGLVDALAGWSGAPSCAIALASAPLAPQQHAELVALGVQAWAPVDALDAAGLLSLLARAQARWQREESLRVALASSLAHLDERKWVERAKGLLMAARHIDEDAAFGLLRTASMHTNLRLGEVSRSVIDTVQRAEAVNRAGQLRMLSQRLVRLAAQSLAAVDVRRSRSLRTQSAARVQENLDHLAALALDTACTHALAQAGAAWQALQQALQARLSTAALATVDARAEVLLAAAEALTDAMEASGARRALHIVNLCGRQRMRAQRLAKDALLGSLLPAGPWAGRVGPTIDEFEATLRELEQAPLTSSDIRAALALARDEWLRLVRGVHNAGRPEGRSDLVLASEVLAETFDRLTASYEHSLQVIMS